MKKRNNDKIVEKYSNDHIQSMADEDALNIMMDGNMLSAAEHYMGIYNEDSRAAQRYSTVLYDRLQGSLSSTQLVDVLMRIFRDLIDKIKTEREEPVSPSKGDCDEFATVVGNQTHRHAIELAKDIASAPNFTAIFGEGMGVRGNNIEKQINISFNSNRKDQRVEIDLSIQYDIVEVPTNEEKN